MSDALTHSVEPVMAGEGMGAASLRSAEPQMAECGVCLYPCEAEDVLTLRDDSRACTGCLDAEYGPDRSRWPL